MVETVPNWAYWIMGIWAALVTIGVTFGVVANVRTKDAQKRSNKRLTHIESQLSGISKMEGHMEAMRDDLVIIKTRLGGK